MTNFNNLTAKEKALKTVQDIKKRRHKKERDKYYKYRRFMIESVERAKK